MNRGPLVFLGAFFALSLSWIAFVLAPQLQIGVQQAALAGQSIYPTLRAGMAQQGREVYRANGCVYCHTEKVLPPSLASDFVRGWGQRQSVAQDYLNETPAFLGMVRLGPDLANVGARQPSELWHLQHLYNARLVSKGSTMPRYRFLFSKRKVGRQPSPEALPLPESETGRGYEIIPKPEARQLAAYLISLQSDVPLFEAPIPQPAGATNQVAGTNAPPGQAMNTNAAVLSNPPPPIRAAVGTNLPAATNGGMQPQTNKPAERPASGGRP